MKYLRSIHMVVMAVTIISAVPTLVSAQEASQSARSAEPSRAELLEQVSILRGQVAKLEAALELGHVAAPSKAAGASDSMNRPPGSDMSGMSGMGDSSSYGGMTGMGMSQSKRVAMMGRMKGAAESSFLTSLPGFPGISHLYHVGASRHFLDHAEHVELDRDQMAALGGIHEENLRQQATSDREVDEAEQQLWTLTGSDSPDAAAIEAQVRRIASLQSEQRLAFIRSVGAAAQVLTDAQRRRLVGAGDEVIQADQPAHDH